jgi:hypothetical protein
MATPQKASRQPARVEQRTGQPGCGSVPPHTEPDALACLGAELLRRAAESQPVLEKAWNELMASWGVHGEPVGVERLRALIQEECGTNSEDNAFSRELIALREERRS